MGCVWCFLRITRLPDDVPKFQRLVRMPRVISKLTFPNSSIGNKKHTFLLNKLHQMGLNIKTSLAVFPPSRMTNRATQLGYHTSAFIPEKDVSALLLLASFLFFCRYCGSPPPSELSEKDNFFISLSPRLDSLARSIERRKRNTARLVQPWYEIE